MGVTLEEVEGGVLMRSSTSDLGCMARVLAELGFPFVVRRTPELRESLGRRAAETATFAGRVRGWEQQRRRKKTTIGRCAGGGSRGARRGG